jgi:phage-related protein
MAKAIKVQIVGDYDDRDIRRAMKDLEKLQMASLSMGGKMQSVGKQMQSMGDKVGKVGGSLTKGVTLPIIAGGAALLAFAKGAEDAEIANRKLGSVLDSMGYPQATKRVSDYAESLERSLAVDADIIKAAQTKLATFKNLTASVDDAGGAFDRATMAALDLAAAGFGSAETNAVQLGKALQDPIKGITALGRAGVTFTDQEKEKIKALVESGNLLDAQNMVLKAIEGQVGGTAEAGASSFDKIKLSLMQVADAIGMAVLPLINQLSDFITTTFVPKVVPMIDQIVASFNNMEPALKKALFIFTGLAAGIGPLLLVAGKLVSVSGVLITALGGITIAGSLLFIKVIAVVAVLAAVALAFKYAYDNSQPLRTAVDNLVTTFKNVFNIIKNSVLGAFDSMNGAVGKSNTAFTLIGNYIKAFFTGYVIYLTTIIKVLGGAFQVAMKVFEIGFTILQMGAGIIRGVLLAAFDILLNKLGPISTAFRAVANGVKSAFGAVAGFVSSAFNNVGKVVETFINFAIKGINLLIRAYNAIPLVSDIAEIAEFSFAKMSGATDVAANSANNLANQVGGYASQVMRGNQVVDAAYDTNMQVAKSLDVVTTTTTGAGSATDKASEKTKKFKEELKRLNDALKDSIQKAKDYATGISDSFVGMLSLSDAFDSFTERQTKVTETLAALTKFQAEIQGEATEDQKASLLSLQAAYQEASAAAAGGAQSVVEEFVNQGKKLSEFTTNMHLLLSKNLSRQAFEAIIAAGSERGAQIADALAQGNIDENIANVNAVYTSVADMGQQVGNQASGNFMMQGVVLAQSMLVGLIKEFMPAGKKRRELLAAINGMVSEAVGSMTAITNVPAPSFALGAAAPVVAPGPAAAFDYSNPNWFGDAVRAGIDPLAGLSELMGGITPFAAGGIVTGPTLGLIGEAGPEAVIPLSKGGKIGGTTINLTVNAGMGTQGAEVGRQIVDALKAYERRNGSVYVSA